MHVASRLLLGTTHSMPVLLTAFDEDFFNEPVIDSDRIESPCKQKCSTYAAAKTADASMFF